MPYYYCEAATADGRIQKRILKARDKKDADSRIRDFGLRPMRIESYHAVRKKKLKALHTRHIVRDTLLGVAGVSLIGGIAVYFIVLDLTSKENFSVKKLAQSGIVSQTPGIINAKTPEEREFAQQAWNALDSSFPGAIGGITVTRKFLMLIYIKNRNQFTDQELESVVSIMTSGLYRRFEASNCIVILVHKNNETIAEGRYVKGKVKAQIY